MFWSFVINLDKIHIKVDLKTENLANQSNFVELYFFS